VRDAGEIERAVAALARSANGGLILTPSGGTSVHRDLIITLAARHKLPAVYSDRFNVNWGRPALLRARSGRSAPPRGKSGSGVIKLLAAIGHQIEKSCCLPVEEIHVSRVTVPL
jgi:hypothetical protein